MHAPRARLVIAAVVSSVCVAASAVLAGPSQAAAPVAADPAVITEWNVIAARTIFTENLVAVPRSGLYFGFMHIAMYDAVVAIEGGYEPYAYRAAAPPTASAEVAAATAAYRVLKEYFPASAANLTADYTAFLAGVPNGVGKVQGRLVGTAAAARIIQLRQNDGRNAIVTLDVEPAPGVWRPTPPAFAPMLAAELGFVTPLLLESAIQFPLPGPDALSTVGYARDYVEVLRYGAKEGSRRTAAQTDTALFYSDNAILQFQTGLRDQVTRRGLDIVESSRAFALLGTSTADALIACWRAKYDYAYWRPVTAIPLAGTDGNPATRPDADWTPLTDTPPYPEYTAGHACVTGATTGTLSHLFGADSLDLNLFSNVTMTTRHYDTADALDRQTMNARIWLGLHFRKAMTDGNDLGHHVSDWASSQYFQPTG